MHMYKSSCVITVNAFVSYEVCVHSDSVNGHFLIKNIKLAKSNLVPESLFHEAV